MIDQFLNLYRVKDRLVGNMPEAQFRILLELAENGPRYTAALSFAPGTTSLRHLGALVDGGLIESAADPDDGRKTVYSITRKGLDMLAVLCPAQQREAA